MEGDCDIGKGGLLALFATDQRIFLTSGAAEGETETFLSSRPQLATRSLVLGKSYLVVGASLAKGLTFLERPTLSPKGMDD